MTKKIPLYDDNLLFLDVLPELNPGFIENVKKVRQAFPPNNITKLWEIH